MSSSPLEPDPANLEEIEESQIKDDMQESPEEKRNRAQSATGDETGMNERQEERPRADTRPPA